MVSRDYVYKDVAGKLPAIAGAGSLRSQTAEAKSEFVIARLTTSTRGGAPLNSCAAVGK